MSKIQRLPVVAKIGDTLVCPGCGETLVLDAYDGWRNANGYTCKPASTMHSQHIETLEARI